MRSSMRVLYIVTRVLATDWNGAALREEEYESTVTVTTTPTSTITSTVSLVYNGSHCSLTSTCDSNLVRQSTDTPTSLVVEPIDSVRASSKQQPTPQTTTSDFCSAAAPAVPPVNASSVTASVASSAMPHVCAVSYAIRKGDTCERVSVEKGLSLVEFIQLNPDLHVERNGSCPLAIGKTVCVRDPTLPYPPLPHFPPTVPVPAWNSSSIRVIPVSTENSGSGRVASTLVPGSTSLGGQAGTSIALPMSDNYTSYASMISSSLLPLGTTDLLSMGPNLTVTTTAATTTGSGGDAIDPSPLVVHPLSESTPSTAQPVSATETKARRGGLWERWLPTSFRTSTVNDEK